MSKETTPDLASLAAKYLGMTDEQLANIPYPQLFDIIRQLAGSVLSQREVAIERDAYKSGLQIMTNNGGPMMVAANSILDHAKQLGNYLRVPIQAITAISDDEALREAP